MLSLSLSFSSSLFLFPLAPTCTACFVWAQLHCWYKPKYLQHKYWQWKSIVMSNCCAGKGDRIIFHESTSFFFSFPLLSQPSVLVFNSCGFADVLLLTWVSPFCVLGLQNITMATRFDCHNCTESLYGRKYIESKDRPYCIPCYDSLFSNTCDECKELIGHDARVRHPF